MRWDRRLGDLFDDLEQQAEGLALAERDAEVAEQSRAEYARVDLAARLHASVGARLLVTVTGVGPVDGLLRRVGEDWCLLEVGEREWIIRTSAAGSLRGLADRAVPEPLRPVTARLGWASAMRGAAAGRGEVVLHRRDGTQARGALVRVGADFVELLGEDEPGHPAVVPLAAVVAVRSG